MDRGSLLPEPILKTCVTIWAPITILIYVSLHAAYLTWMLTVLLDLLVPPWYECAAVSAVFCALRWLLRPSTLPIFSFVKRKCDFNGHFFHLATRQCTPQNALPSQKLKVSPAGSPVCTKSNSLPKLQPKHQRRHPPKRPPNSLPKLPPKHRRRHRPKLPLNSLPKLQPRLQPKLPLNSPPKL
jgi:hypothetical protein